MDESEKSGSQEYLSNAPSAMSLGEGLSALRAMRHSLRIDDAIPDKVKSWSSTLEAIENRLIQLERQNHDLICLTDQLTENNALLLDLKYQADQAEAKAIACDSGKTQFLARISHEIRSPLSVILGYADQILEDSVTLQQSRHIAGHIRQTGDFVLDVINEVLDLSKIEAGAFTLSAHETPLIPLIREVFDLFEHAAFKRGIGFELKVSYPLPETIFVDGHRLKQVLVNLCSNALKFTEKGKVSLTCWYENNHINFEVQDTGIGMTETQLSKIFKPFTQAEDTISSRFGGTGLGLCIAYEIVEQMGGKLTVESTMGKGSCFAVDLSLAGQSYKLVEQVVHSNSILRSTEEVQQLSGKVVVAEDTKDLQMIIGAVLKKAGLDVTLVNNGQQALDAYKEGDYDLVILDIEMPVMDGLTAMKAIKSLQQENGLRPVPVLALTAHAFKDEVVRLGREGFNDVIIKPFKRQLLLESLAGWLGNDTKLH